MSFPWKNNEGRNFFFHVHSPLFQRISHSIWGFISQTEFEMSPWIKISNEILIFWRKKNKEDLKKNIRKTLFLWIRYMLYIFLYALEMNLRERWMNGNKKNFHNSLYVFYGFPFLCLSTSYLICRHKKKERKGYNVKRKGQRSFKKFICLHKYRYVDKIYSYMILNLMFVGWEFSSCLWKFCWAIRMWCWCRFYEILA